MPKWAAGLLRRLAPADRAEDVVGDLEEAHARRVERRGALVARVLTAVETLDVAFALLRMRAGERREGRVRGRLLRNVAWIDFKLGFRMLVKYPGLTLVGGFAMAFAIWLGAVTFEVVKQAAFPDLGLTGGERVVGLRLWDVSAGRAEPRIAHDFGTWREDLASVDELGAFRTLERNLVIGAGRGEPVEVAEMSAAGFRVARVPPLLGRTLVEEDERTGAPVVVIGYDLWQSRFHGDSSAVGSTVRLNAEARTVVGVMPEGFGFPVSHHAWTPLTLNPAEHGPRQGPGLRLFGRLASGASLEGAQAELAALGRSAAAAYPETHEHLRPQVLPYARSVLGTLIVGDAPGWLVAWAMMSSNLVLILLLLLICANIALLMFARSATRESEIIVRNALGASRGRIIMQLFIEALVLGAVATALGLAAARAGLTWGLAAIETEFGELPFWITNRLSPATVAYAALLAVVGAVVAGVVPALKITRHVSTRLREATPGAGGLRFGGLWTVVIVTQVAITVTFPAVAFFLRRDAQEIRNDDVGFATQQYLSARVEIDRASGMAQDDTSSAALARRYATVFSELEQRLGADPAIAGVTFGDRLPRAYHAWNQIEVLEGAAAPPDARGHRVGSVSVDPAWFDVLGTPLVAGRAFHSGDLLPGARSVIVNQPFVEQVLGGRNPIGRHVRYVASESRRTWDAGPWHEIVGVAPDLGTKSGYGRAGIYHPAERGASYPVHIVLHVRGEPDAFVPDLRAIAADVDPALRLHDVMRLDRVVDTEVRFYQSWFRLTVVVSAIALFLSLAGIYAVMSFTVARRTREIGIRVALGAVPRRIALSIFRRPLTQVGAGIVLGMLVTTLLSVGYAGVYGDVGDLVRGVLFLLSYAAFTIVVCALACVVPTRRALGVEPTQAMRADG